MSRGGKLAGACQVATPCTYPFLAGRPEELSEMKLYVGPVIYCNPCLRPAKQKSANIPTS